MKPQSPVGAERNTKLCVFLILFLSVSVLLPRAGRAGNFYSGTTPATVPWPGGIVPYEFTNTLSSAQKQTYLDGLREWTLAANVQFVPHTTQSHWILFTYNTNYIDNVSGTTNPQVVTVSSLSRAQVCHEMGHSFGFTHENIRPDAANFITVLTNNITNEPANIFFFTTDPTSVTNGNYDFESVMHLGWDFQSINLGVLATQQPRPAYIPRYQYRMGNYALSPGDRAALKFLYGPPAVPLTNIVTTTADSGPGSLRAAMYYATDHPGTPVKFNIPTSDPGYSNGVFNIHLSGHLPPLATNGLVIDGSTQPGFTSKPLIFVDGSQIIPETKTSNSGLLIYSASNQIKNISFSGFNWNGLTLEFADATNNTIAGCWLGVDATGSNAAPNNYQGIRIASGASRNIIGGTNALARNVLSGNSQYGILITDSNTSGNVVLGNYIGTDSSGSVPVPNLIGGVLLTDATTSNILGGTSAGARNVISGNNTYLDYGVLVTGIGTSGNLVEGNYIGLGAGGEAAVSNYFGIAITGGATGNAVGGVVAGARNVVSGNFSYGVMVKDPGTTGNVVAENYAGLDAGGMTAMPNYMGVICYNGATNNLIGGTGVGAGNYVSGNTLYGVCLSDPGTDGNFVEGNFIGTDWTGTNGVGNFDNVELQGGAAGNFIGGLVAGAGNVIAYASFVNVILYDVATTNNSIRGNSIFNNPYSGVGIHLVGYNYYPYVTSNHVGFAAGPNNLQNFPVLTNAFGYGASTIVAGSLNSLASGTYFIDVYRSASPDYYTVGYGQGQFYVGSVTATTDGSGNAKFSLTNTAANYSGQYFTATATDAIGNTSEFSAAVLATNAPAPSAQFGTPFSWQTNGFIFNLTFATNFSYHLQATTNLVNPLAWVNLTNFNATSSSLTFTDRTATNFSRRFYRIVSP